MILLGLETSCDETACAIVSDEGGGRILSNKVRSQIEDHARYGGVVPEVAARQHLAHLAPLLEQAMAEAEVEWSDIDAVAATAGPGLIGGLLVGLTAGKALAWARGLPFIAVNHLEAHALTARLSHQTPFPYLLLLMSGGHCQILWVEGVGQYRRLGTTIDDALGEAFDKSAKIMGLGYPGGPALEKEAARGRPGRIALPRPMKGAAHADFSFSGLKTAVRTAWEKLGPQADGRDAARADIAAEFHEAVTDVLLDRLGAACRMVNAPRRLVIAGGVAANQRLRRALDAWAQARAMTLIAPPMALCTDNAAMVAWAGLERLRLGRVDDLNAPARPRWPLDETAPPKPYAGVKA